MADVLERLIIAEQKVVAAHHRMDKFEKDAKEDLKDIKRELVEIKMDVKEIIAWKNRSLGIAAAAVLLASLFSSGMVGAIMRHLLRQQ